MKPSIVWFRDDLRIEDNAALAAALSRGGPVVPVFIWAPEDYDPWAPGDASRWWLARSLRALARDLERVGSRLTVRRGPTLDVLADIARETGAAAVFYNRSVGPAARRLDGRIAQMLARSGIEIRELDANLLVEPESFANRSGKPYRVFTPFWRALLERAPRPMPKVDRDALRAPAAWPKTIDVESLELDAGAEIAESLWEPGERGARSTLAKFMDSAAASYEERRDRPDVEGTSRLSPHLHFGEISPARVWHELRRARIGGDGPDPFLRQIAWREFGQHLLYHFPATVDSPLNPRFSAFPWREDPDALDSWRRGMTGYPIVDAGMRELARTGWMHNRVRMVVASFLTKHLRIHWLEGARWFWQTLVDADLGNNTLGWQWVAGSGADAAPYFRVFNPVLQGEKFDPDGDYVRRWVPEVAALPSPLIHRPWTGSDANLERAGVRLGDTYPHPIVDHAQARREALHAYDTIKADSQTGVES